MVCYFFGIKPPPEPMLTYYQLDAEIQTPVQWNLSTDFSLKDALENNIFKMTAICPSLKMSSDIYILGCWHQTIIHQCLNNNEFMNKQSKNSSVGMTIQWHKKITNFTRLMLSDLQHQEIIKFLSVTKSQPSQAPCISVVSKLLITHRTKRNYSFF